jgi:hypothetical protein
MIELFADIVVCNDELQVKYDSNVGCWRVVWRYDCLDFKLDDATYATLGDALRYCAYVVDQMT